MRESGAQSCHLFHRLTVSPQGTEMGAWTSLGSPMGLEGRISFPLMTEQRGNPSAYVSAKSVSEKRQKAAPTGILHLCHYIPLLILDSGRVNGSNSEHLRSVPH